MIFDFLLEKLTQEYYPKVHMKRCIHYNPRPNDCSRCKNLCPHKAITFSAGELKIDESLCSRCGICKGVCPTEAIIMSGLGEEKVLDTIKDKSNIVFSCSKKSGEGTLEITCLHALHPELLASLFIEYPEKEFKFNLSKCKSCDLYKNKNILEESIEKAVKFVSMLSITPQYDMLYEENGIKEIREEAISRRDLFSLFRRESTNLATQTIGTVVREKDDNVFPRKILLKSIKEMDGLINKEENKAGIFFGTWSVSKECDGCERCQSVCPGAAWKVEKTDEKLVVYHDASKCYNCGTCAVLCNKGAINREDLSWELLDVIHTKIEKDLLTCSDCERKFAPKNELQKKCNICEKKETFRATFAEG